MIARLSLALNGLLLAACSGLIYLNYGGWMFILATFAGFGVVVLALSMSSKSFRS